MPVTKETIFFDRTNLVLSRAAEVGEVLGVTPETARKRRQRAREALARRSLGLKVGPGATIEYCLLNKFYFRGDSSGYQIPSGSASTSLSHHNWVLHAFNRNGVLFPEKVRGRYLRLDRPNRADLPGQPGSGEVIRLSESKDMATWRPVGPVMRGRWHYFDELIGAGPPPINLAERSDRFLRSRTGSRQSATCGGSDSVR